MNNKVSLSCPHCGGSIDLFASEEEAAREKRDIPISIVCITRAEPQLLPLLEQMSQAAVEMGGEFVLGLDWEPDFEKADDIARYSALSGLSSRIIFVKSKGYVESVLQYVIDKCKGEWIFRLDDDEGLTPAGWEWMKERKYEANDNWLIPTAALWGDDEHFITSPPFWADRHMRLSRWDKIGTWPDAPHAHPGFDHSRLPTTPFAILHYKYLLRSYEERRDDAEVREALVEDAGLGKRTVYSLPEDVLPYLILHPVGDGIVSTVKSGDGVRVDVARKES